MSDVNVTVASRTVTLDGGRGSVAVSVTNAAGVVQRIVLGAYGATASTSSGAQDGSDAVAAQLAAATLIERPLREIPPGATEQYVATITRDGVAAGVYGVTFIAYPADRAPEEYGDQAQVVQVVVPAAGGTPPPPGRRWWLVALLAALVVAAGAVVFALTRPSSVIVPGVIGESSEDAEASLDVAGLEVVVETEVGPEPLDTVVGQTPEEGSEVRAGSSVTIVVQVGVTLPDVVGQPVEEALAVLDDAVTVEQEPQESAATAGTVLRMVPPAGTEVGAGSVVRLTVASERTVVVPDVTRVDASEAASRLEGVGLRPRLVRGSLCRLPFSPVCTVVVQEPPAGSPVPSGSAVTLRTL